MAWVLGKKRLVERSQLFAWTAGGGTHGGRLVFARAHKTLIARYDELRAALLEESLGGELTERKVVLIVNSVLSERDYATLVRRAQTQTKQRQEEIDFSMESGEYLWD